MLLYAAAPGTPKCIEVSALKVPFYTPYVQIRIFFVHSVTKPIATEESISLKTPTFHNRHTRVTSLLAKQDKKARADLTSSINPTSPHRHKHNLSTQPHVPIVEVEIHSSFFSSAFVSRAFTHTVQWLKIRIDNIVFCPVTTVSCLQLILCNDTLNGNTLKKKTGERIQEKLHHCS